MEKKERLCTVGSNVDSCSRYGNYVVYWVDIISNPLVYDQNEGSKSRVVLT